MLKQRDKSMWDCVISMLVAQVIISFYMFYIVPSTADADFIYCFFSFLSGDAKLTLPYDFEYLLPIMLFLPTVIFLLSSRVIPWILGMLSQYMALFVLFITLRNSMNAFAFTKHDGLDGAATIIIRIPFYCIFFFLWELLFCCIAKRLRRRREGAEDRGGGEE